MTLRAPIAAFTLFCALLLPGTARADGRATSLPAEDLAVRIRTARIAGMEGDLHRQRRILEEIAGDHPLDSSALVALMDLYLSLPHRSEEALTTRASLARLLKEPGRAAPLAILQSFALDEGATADDLEMIAQVLEGRVGRGPAEPSAILLLAGIHEGRGRREAAREVLGRLLEARGDPGVRQRCLYLDIELQRWDDALGLLRDQRRVLGASKLRLASTFIFSALGMTEELAAEVNSIRTDSLVFTRELIHPLIEAGFALHDGGYLEEAGGWFRLLETRFPADASVRSAAEGLFGPRPGREPGAQGLPVELLNEGSALLSAGDPHRAYSVLRRAATRMEDNDLAWFNLGLAAAGLQRWTEAEAAFNRAVTLSPGFHKALIQRAQARLRLGRLDEAAADAARALEKDRDSKDAVLILYHCAREQGDEKEAKRLRSLYRGM